MSSAQGWNNLVQNINSTKSDETPVECRGRARVPKIRARYRTIRHVQDLTLMRATSIVGPPAFNIDEMYTSYISYL